MDGGILAGSLYQNETAVIGSLLISPDSLETIESILTPADFNNELCRETWLAALRLRDNNAVVDPLTIAAELKRATRQDRDKWLVECTDVTPSAANVEAYCRLVKQEACARRMQKLAESIGDAIYNHEDWQSVAATASAEIVELQAEAEGDVIDSKAMSTGFLEYYDKVVKNPDFAFCKTGYSKLDAKLGGGMYRQGMYIVGARPGMGKTTLGINIADNVARAGKSVLMVSLEMGRTQIMAKRIAAHVAISYTALMSGQLSAARLNDARMASESLAERPFYLVDKSRQAVADIGRAARKIKGLSLIVVDYLGLVKPPEEDSLKPRYEQMTNISADLKALAKLLKIPIIVLCQLNRENTKSTDKRPQLQDLRDSGAIEQDADAVIMIHRPEYYSKDKLEDDYIPPEREEIELIIAKNRHGETGLAKMQWRGETGEIREVDTMHSEPQGKIIHKDELPF